jgi:hypothetical protein
MAVLTQDGAGVGGLFNTPLARPTYYNKIMAKVYERDFLREITNSEISERITQCSQTVQIMKAPEVAPWRPYQINQQMVNSTVTTTAISLSVCYAAYQSLKFDNLTIHYACEHWEEFEKKVLEACYEAFVADQREWVFTSMVAQVSPHNQGAHAGRHRNLDLGSVGAPRQITRSTLPGELAKMKQVLQEHLSFVSGNMFLIVPPEIDTVLVYTDFANKAWVGGSGMSLAVDGAWTQPLLGFNVIETNHLLWTQDSGQICYYILAGHRDAFAYASDIIQSRVVTGIDSFASIYQMLAVWGGAMLYPNYLVMGYWYFDPISQ